MAILTHKMLKRISRRKSPLRPIPRDWYRKYNLGKFVTQIWQNSMATGGASTTGGQLTIANTSTSATIHVCSNNVVTHHDLNMPFDRPSREELAGMVLEEYGLQYNRDLRQFIPEPLVKAFKSGLMDVHTTDMAKIRELKDMFRVQKGKDITLLTDDGSVLFIYADGKIRVEDAYAKTTYEANRCREFNPYLNASDMIEGFIKYAGSLKGVSSGDILDLPLNLFIHWLILQAAKKDGDPLEQPERDLKNARLALPAPTENSIFRCLGCGRFLPKVFEKARIAYCGPDHFQLHANRHGGLIVC